MIVKSFVGLWESISVGGAFEWVGIYVNFVDVHIAVFAPDVANQDGIGLQHVQVSISVVGHKAQLVAPRALGTAGKVHVIFYFVHHVGSLTLRYHRKSSDAQINAAYRFFAFTVIHQTKIVVGDK